MDLFSEEEEDPMSPNPNSNDLSSITEDTKEDDLFHETTPIQVHKQHGGTSQWTQLGGLSWCQQILKFLVQALCYYFIKAMALFYLSDSMHLFHAACFLADEDLLGS